MMSAVIDPHTATRRATSVLVFPPRRRPRRSERDRAVDGDLGVPGRPVRVAAGPEPGRVRAVCEAEDVPEIVIPGAGRGVGVERAGLLLAVEVDVGAPAVGAERAQNGNPGT